MTVFTRRILTSLVPMAFASFVAAGSASATVVASESFETPAFNRPAIQYSVDQFLAHNQNTTGPVSITNFVFSGYSGLITNGTLGVFNPTSSGNQSAFLQAYSGDGFNGGSQIDWNVSGLTPGQLYRLTFSDAGSLIVPTAVFTVSGLGIASTSFNPGTTFTSNSLDFTPTNSSGVISFAVQGAPGNFATALDALSISAVPEPATWALMLIGFGMIGFAMRKRSNVRTTVSYA